MTETPDSEYFDVTAVPVNVDYEECAPVEDLTGSNMRPAYDVRLTVKEVIPASLVTHDVVIDVDVSATSYREICIIMCRITQEIHLPGKGNHI